MTLLLCSRNESVLRRWTAALKSEHQVHEAMALADAARISKKVDVDLLLLHRSMVDAEQLIALSSAQDTPKLFVLSDRPTNEEGLACLKLGCVGYSNTYIAAPRLSLAVQTVLSGLVWTGTSLMQHLITRIKDIPADSQTDAAGVAAPATLAELSKREYQIASLVAEGLQNKEIAERLDIAERTVKAHLSSVYAKTTVSNRIGLAKLFASQ